MEQITFEIPPPPEMSVEERNKLVRQAADTGFIIFLKYFIPLFFIRYWKTRFYQSALIWYFLLNYFGMYVLVSAIGTMADCAIKEECSTADVQTVGALSVVIGAGAFVVVGISAGSSSKRARTRLGIDRKTALAILPAIKD